MNKITDELNNKPKEVTFANYLYSVLWKYDIQIDGEIGTINLIDLRTMQMIQTYSFYRNNPHLAFDCEAWFIAYPLIDRILSPSLL